MKVYKVAILRKELVGIDQLKSINDACHPVFIFNRCLVSAVPSVVDEVIAIRPLKVGEFDQLSDEIGGPFLRRPARLNLLVPPTLR